MPRKIKCGNTSNVDLLLQTIIRRETETERGERDREIERMVGDIVSTDRPQREDAGTQPTLSLFYPPRSPAHGLVCPHI